MVLLKNLLLNVVNFILLEVSRLMRDLTTFPLWFFIGSLGFWWRIVTRTFLRIYDNLGLEIMIRSMFAPFRGDKTFVGYFMGIVIRIIWSVFSLVILTIILIAGLSITAAFYVVPFAIGYYYSWWLLPYLVFLLFIFLELKKSQRYWQAVKAGDLDKNLRLQVWRRLALKPLEAEVAFNSKIEDFHLYLRKHKLNDEDFISVKKWVLRAEFQKLAWRYWRDEFFFRKVGVNVGWVAGFIPELKKFSIDLTKAAAIGDLPHVYGREREVEQILTTLGRPLKNNVLLVGEAGVGKTSLVYSVAWLILGARGELELPTVDYLTRPIHGRRVIELNTGGMVGSNSQRGSLEARFSKVLRELNSGQTILFVSQIENMVQAGLLGYLTPIIRSTRFPIIATTTPNVFNETLKKYPEFTTEFEVIRISPPALTEAIRILEGVASEIERHRRVFFTYPALHTMVELSERYIHTSALPEKAITTLIKAVELAGGGNITIEHAAAAVAAISGVPVGDLSREEADKLLNLEQLLKKRIIGQDEAVRTIAKALRRARTGVASQSRPIASLLFLGPTGVGKTLTAKTLAQVYFTPQSVTNVTESQLNALVEASFVRFDMSEFSEPGAVNNFIVRLTTAVAEKPFTLLLLDEFEKAEAPIHNLFLQVFEDGRLTSPSGDTVDFRSAIIIATSNAVTMIPPNTEVEVYVRQKLQERFRPELINRFDGVVLFNMIGENEIQRIVAIELSGLAKRLKDEYEINLTWSDALIFELTKIGFDPEYGARPLKRVIQDRLEDSLAQRILRKELQVGDNYQLTPADLH